MFLLPEMLMNAAPHQCYEVTFAPAVDKYAVLLRLTQQKTNISLILIYLFLPEK